MWECENLETCLPQFTNASISSSVYNLEGGTKFFFLDFLSFFRFPNSKSILFYIKNPKVYHLKGIRTLYANYLHQTPGFHKYECLNSHNQDPLTGQYDA